MAFPAEPDSLSDPAATPPPLPRRVRPGFRRGLVIVSLVLSGYGILMPLMFLLAGSDGSAPPPWGIWLWLLVVAYAWVAWLHMARHWIHQRRLRRLWPVTGTLAGCLSMLVGFPITLMFTLPAVVMGVVFVRFHLRRDEPAARLDVAG